METTWGSNIPAITYHVCVLKAYTVWRQPQFKLQEQYNWKERKNSQEAARGEAAGFSNKCCAPLATQYYVLFGQSKH